MTKKQHPEGKPRRTPEELAEIQRQQRQRAYLQQFRIGAKNARSDG